ncbi:MAG: dynamin family protein [Rhizomicrobium sp.]
MASDPVPTTDQNATPGTGFVPAVMPLDETYGIESVGVLIDRSCETIPLQTSALETTHKRLRGLAERLRQGQLQLAVVGQFKRGKSTLLNAILGAKVLPSAVTPLTAIPTFIRGGLPFGLHTVRSDGGREDLEASSVEDLYTLLAARVTENENPRNQFGYQRVDVLIDAPLLHEGIVLIDTPGVGSTFRHNTDAAKAALPECDMALFVVSPDPPITEVELIYLRELQAVTSNIVIVLNKIDLVDAEDRILSERFLSDTVVKTAGLKTPWFFSVSARNALDAKLQSKNDLLAKSGLPALESYLTNFARTQRHEVLEAAVAGKAAALVQEMIFEVDCWLAIYRMPVEDLSDRLAQFVTSGETFERERRVSHDILSADRVRLMCDLDERAATLRKAIKHNLYREIDGMLAHGVSEEEIVAKLQTRIPKMFQSEFDDFETDARGVLKVLLHTHQEKGDSLIGNVRRLASTLLEIPYAAPVADDAFLANKTPYWVTAPRESLAALPTVIDILLPTGMRLERVRARLRRQIDDITIRNVENLRWALRQNLEASIRGFQTQLDERLRLSQEATAMAIKEGIKRRSAAQASTHEDMERLTSARQRLVTIVTRLEMAK